MPAPRTTRAAPWRSGTPYRPATGETGSTACCHAALAGLAGRDGSGVPAAEASSHAAEAMALLRRAVSMGYRNADTLRNEDALSPLRGRDDFRLLLLDLSIPADPFASDH